MTYARIVVSDKSGQNLAEIAPDLAYVSWRISKVGEAEFTMAVTDPKSTETNLRFGNRVLVQFENGLPNWAGVLDTPRVWKPGLITCKAYSPEHIFKTRITGKSKFFTSVTAGAVYKELIQDANQNENTGVVVGNVWTGGTALSAEFHYESLLGIFQNYLTLGESGAEFDITGKEQNGYIVLEANFYQKKGTTKLDQALLEGANVTSATLKEEGPIVNAQYAVGKGTDWGDSRVSAYLLSQISIDAYGLREAATLYSGETLKSTIEDRAFVALLDTLAPFNSYELEVLDEDPGEFQAYGVGDYVALSLQSYGFGGTNAAVRILAREYRPADNQSTLIVQEE